jgi:hypothetical protein
MAANRTTRREDLCNIPLVRQMLSDPQVVFAPRGIDAAWAFEKIIPISTVGFNPLRTSIYVARQSFLARWLEKPHASARRLNQNDVLMGELLMAVHDYLHCWAYLAIDDLMPELGFGTAPITAETLEQHVFCHLLTEAVAVVGLDYWYLSTVKLNDVCDVGTAMTGLAVDFHESFEAEYRRFNPELTVQDPAFLEQICHLYASGVMRGFDVAAVKQSPLLLKWLKHELAYSERQRAYARSWFAYLAPTEIAIAPERLGAPVAVSGRWAPALVRKLARALWHKVKHDELQPFRRSLRDQRAWRAPKSRRYDYRFLNAAVIDAEDPGDERGFVDESFPFYVWQKLSRARLDRFDRALLCFVKTCVEARDRKAVRALLRQQPTVAAATEERDLFFPN